MPDAATWHILALRLPAALRGALEWALVELGLRLGGRFALHRDRASLPANAALVLHYGVGDAADDEIALPFDPGPARAIALPDGATLWASGDAAAPDLVAGAAHLLTFGHEAACFAPAASPGPDAFGRIPPAAHPLARAGLRLVPLIERAAAHLRARIAAAGQPLPPAPDPWGGGRAAVVLTHDVDGERLHDAFVLARAAWLGLARGNRAERDALALGLGGMLRGRADPYWNFAGWAALEAELGGRGAGSFYVWPGATGAAARHPRDCRYDIGAGAYNAALRALVAEGFDVGVHYGINSHSPAGYAEAFARLREALGAAPAGGRAHYWAVRWADMIGGWRDLARAGFAYDASLTPLDLGWRNGARLPLLPALGWGGAEALAKDAPAPFVALPTPVMDGYAVPRQAGRPEAEIAAELDAILAESLVPGGLLVLNWHSRTLQDAGSWQGYMPPLRRILARARDSGIARFLSGAEAAALWVAHARASFAGIGGR
ncbi:MAG: hypothetical protein IT557_15265 [Alphaproteobacteria bacterium]|nr:hypothetical protein [Alphaproteobacteria bacterium]